MKRLIPVYALLTLMLAAIVTFGVLGLRKIGGMQRQLSAIEIAQTRPFGSERFKALQVEVINRPSVNVLGTVDVDVSEPLSVNVDNEVEVHCTNCYRY